MFAELPFPKSPVLRRTVRFGDAHRRHQSIAPADEDHTASAVTVRIVLVTPDGIELGAFSSWQVIGHTVRVLPTVMAIPASRTFQE
jgi:hypothetical protein